MRIVNQGSYEARGLRIAVVASRFNESISKLLVEGAVDCLGRHGLREDDYSVTWVPGAFELPVAVKKIAEGGDVDAIVCVGAVIRGETAHFDYVAGQAASGIMQVSLATGIPVAFGVLTTESVEQAADRAGGKLGNKGFDAALAAIEMANLLSGLGKPD